MVAAQELKTVQGNRQHVRIETSLPIQYSSEKDRVTHLCRTANISKGGVYIVTPEVIQPQTKLNLLIPIFDQLNRFGKQRIIVKGFVVHSDKGKRGQDDARSGLGVEFAGLGQYNWHQVLKTISKYLRNKDHPDIKQMIKDAQTEYGELAEGAVEVPDEEPEEQEVELELDGIDKPGEKPESFVKRQKRIPKLFRGRFLTPHGEIMAYITNLSHGGVGFVSPEYFSVGDLIALSMGTTVINDSYVRGRIVHRKTLVEGLEPKYSYGVSFEERNARFSMLVDSLDHQTQTELKVPIHLGISLK